VAVAFVVVLLLVVVAFGFNPVKVFLLDLDVCCALVRVPGFLFA
jgi:hypothetical protein